MIVEPDAPAPAKRLRRPVLQAFFEWLKHPLIIAVISIFLTLIVQQVLVQLTQPPGPPTTQTVTALMNQETQAAMAHDTALVGAIYDANAVVMDAGCQTPNQGTVWSGLAAIMTRYRVLPQFASLNHTDPQVSWIQNNASATVAYVSATTIGALANAGGGSGQLLLGHEQWVFAKVHGQWVITVFTYNLCLP
jgi:hypothetical protein